MILLANTSLTQLIKKCAIEAFKASKPSDVMIGKIKTVSPLTISIGQQLVVDEDFLIVCDTARTKLAKNKSVALVRQSGGQRFLIIDTIS